MKISAHYSAMLATIALATGMPPAPRFLCSPIMGRNRYWTCARSQVPKLFIHGPQWRSHGEMMNDIGEAQ